MNNKDYSKLRPFDLEAAKAGDLLCNRTENGPYKYIAGPDSDGGIVTLSTASGRLIRPLFPSEYRMAPLAWVRASADDDTLWPVYKGDVLWHPSKGKCKIDLLLSITDHVAAVHDSGVFSVLQSVYADALTFTPPKVKRQIKLVAFIDDQGDLRWVREELFANRGLRVPLEDRMVEVEEPAGQEGSA